MTELIIESGELQFLPTFAKALVSLGKQDPPNAGPALKNLEPILLSSPIPRAHHQHLHRPFHINLQFH